MGSVSCLKFLSLNGDFGSGFSIFWCFNHFFNLLGLLLLFGLGLKMLHHATHCKGLSRFLCDFGGKSSALSIGFCSKICFDGKGNPNIPSSKRGLKFVENSISPMATDNMEENKEIVYCEVESEANIVSGDDNDDIDYNKREECYDVDEVVDVMTLRKLVKSERLRANAACLELEKERMATATATEEAMAMILQLQNKRSLIELEANQFRRLVEEKQQHDQDVIQSLRWIVMKLESERSLLEGQLRLLGAKFEGK